MSLSADSKLRLKYALANAAAAVEVAAAIDSSGSGPATYVAPFGTTTNIAAANCAGAATPSATNVNSAIDTATATIESRLDAIETKLNAVLSALVAASLMASS